MSYADQALMLLQEYKDEVYLKCVNNDDVSSNISKILRDADYEELSLDYEFDNFLEEQCATQEVGKELTAKLMNLYVIEDMSSAVQEYFPDSHKSQYTGILSYMLFQNIQTKYFNALKDLNSKHEGTYGLLSVNIIYQYVGEFVFYESSRCW